MTVTPQKPAATTTDAQGVRPSGVTPAHFAELKTQAKTLVGTTFFAQMLKQMRDSPFKSDLFSGGRGGQAYGSMYDQQLATRMSQKMGDKLVRPIVMKSGRLSRTAYDKLNQEAKGVAHDRRA